MMEGNQDQLMCSKDESLFVPVPNRLNCYTVRPSFESDLDTVDHDFYDYAVPVPDNDFIKYCFKKIDA